jgi:hypothetical protein
VTAFFCPLCHAAVELTDVQPETQTVRCRVCSAEYSTNQLLDERGNPADPLEHCPKKIPRKDRRRVQVREDGSGLVFTIKANKHAWFLWLCFILNALYTCLSIFLLGDFLAALPSAFAALPSAFTYVPYIPVSVQILVQLFDQLSPHLNIVGLLIYMIVVLFDLYSLFCGWFIGFPILSVIINRHNGLTYRINRERFTITHHPLPWPGKTLDLDLDSVEQLYVKQDNPYSLNTITHSGRHTQLLDNLPLDVALCLKQEIEQWLQAERNSHPLNAALDADQDAEQHLSMSDGAAWEEHAEDKRAEL